LFFILFIFVFYSFQRLYLKWFFNDKGKETINKDITVTKQIVEKLVKIENQNFEKNKKNINNLNNENKTKSEKIEIKRIINLNNEQLKIIKFIINAWYRNTLNKDDKIDLYNTIKVFLYENNIKIKDKDLINIVKDYENYLDNNLKIDNYCYYNFCKNKKTLKYYNYVKKAILYNQQNLRQYIKQVSNDLGQDPRLFYTILIIENVRMHTTYKWWFKQVFLKYKVPLLTVMTKFSYWPYGIKLVTLDKIINHFDIIKNKVPEKYKNFINYIKNSFYYYQNGKYKRKSNLDNIIIKNIKNYKNSTIILGIFFKIIDEYRKDIKDYRYNPGIKLTLWNIWKIKKWNKNRKFGGAYLNFWWKNFGEIGQIIYYSLELEHIIHKLNEKYK